MRLSNHRIAVPVIGCWLCAAASAQVTQRVSVATGGGQGNSSSSYASISADGRFVSFFSAASNLVPGDTNAAWDAFVRDRQLGTTERVSVDSSGLEGNGPSSYPSLSADGRFVAFASEATNLVPGDTNGSGDIFVRDRELGTTELVSVNSSGIHGNHVSGFPSISADGRYVVFESRATNLVPGDTNGTYDVFIRDRQLGTTERVSVDSLGTQGNNESHNPTISADGRYVTFTSYANNLVPMDTNQFLDVFIRDRLIGTTERVSVSTTGIEGNGNSGVVTLINRPTCVSADGRFVAFHSNATNLVAVDTNLVQDVFVRDRLLGTTERVSLSSGGTEGNDESWAPSISADGRYVAFHSFASNLVPPDIDGDFDVFVRDRQLGTTELASVRVGVMHRNGDNPAISPDGRYVAFDAFSLVPDDTNLAGDAYVRDRFGGSSFTSLCDPGAGGVISCPCSNSPSGSGRGCDNSANTGGASLSASGGAFLSSDSLILSTSGEKPTATSVLLQGTSSLAAGAVYGQGVRCVGGTLKRLFTESASGGSITAPNFGAGDPTVSARSAAKGNPISAGQSRWYLVFYRDPTVLGGCPSSSTFNATQTGQITWSP